MLLSCFNKFLKSHLLRKRLVSFLARHIVLFNYQYGFRKLHSTKLALIEFTDNSMRFLGEGNYCISVFIDLTNAFDMVGHNILLHKREPHSLRWHVICVLDPILITDLSTPP